MTLSVRDVHVAHDKDVRLFEMTGATASVRLALAKTMPENGSKVPATAAFGVSSSQFTPTTAIRWRWYERSRVKSRERRTIRATHENHPIAAVRVPRRGISRRRR